MLVISKRHIDMARSYGTIPEERDTRRGTTTTTTARAIRIALASLLLSAVLVTMIALARRNPQPTQLQETKLVLAPLQTNTNSAPVFPPVSSSLTSGGVTPPSDADVASFQPQARFLNWEHRCV